MREISLNSIPFSQLPRSDLEDITAGKIEIKERPDGELFSDEELMSIGILYGAALLKARST